MNLIRNEKLKRNEVAKLQKNHEAKIERKKLISNCIDKHLDNNYHIWTT